MSDPNQPWTIKRLLEWTAAFFQRKGVDSPRLSSEMLLSHVLGLPRIQLYTNFEKVPTEPQTAAYRELVRRAVEHEPIAYLTGKAPFFNLQFDVSPAVLIPRSDTETLVEHVLQLARRTSGFEAPRVLDLCTGSGCIAAAIAHHHKHSTVVATDVSAAALAMAKTNVEKIGVADRVTLLEGDLFDALTGHVDPHPFDFILSNPPYIASDKIPSLDRSVKDFEPMLALDGGGDGLDFHRRILKDAPSRLRSAGRIYLEIAFDQGEAALALLQSTPEFTQASLLRDLGGKDRVVTAVRV